MRIYVEGNALVVESDAGDVQTIEFRDLQIRHGKRADFTEEDFNLVGRPLFAEDTGEFMIALGNGQYYNFTQSLLELYEQLREQLQLAIDRGEFQGMPGKEGDPGWTPQFTIGTVEAVSDTTKVQVSLTGTMKDPVLNFWLPIGMTEEGLKAYIDALFEDKTMEVDAAIGELGDKVDALEQEINLVANDVEKFVSKTPYNLNEEALTFGGSDLGQIVTPGRYKRESVNVGDPDTLYPDSTDKRLYTLTVEMYGEDEYRQTVIYDTGRTFVRSGNVGTWTDWNEVMGEKGVSRMINEEVLSKSPALMAVSSAPVTDDECIQPGVYNVSDTVGGSDFAVMQVFKLSNEVMVQVKTTYDDPNLAQKEGSVKVRLYQSSPTGSKFSEWRDVGKGLLVPEDKGTYTATQQNDIYGLEEGVYKFKILNKSYLMEVFKIEENLYFRRQWGIVASGLSENLGVCNISVGALGEKGTQIAFPDNPFKTSLFDSMYGDLDTLDEPGIYSDPNLGTILVMTFIGENETTEKYQIKIQNNSASWRYYDGTEWYPWENLGGSGGSGGPNEDITKGWVTRCNGSIVTDEFYHSIEEKVVTRVTGVQYVKIDAVVDGTVTLPLDNTAVPQEIDEAAVYEGGVCKVCLSYGDLEGATIWELCTWSRDKDSLVIALGSILDEAKSTDNLLCVF